MTEGTTSVTGGYMTPTGNLIELLLDLDNILEQIVRIHFLYI